MVRGYTKELNHINFYIQAIHFIYYDSAPRYTTQILNAQDILESSDHLLISGFVIFKWLDLFTKNDVKSEGEGNKKFVTKP